LAGSSGGSVSAPASALGVDVFEKYFYIEHPDVTAKPRLPASSDGRPLPRPWSGARPTVFADRDAP